MLSQKAVSIYGNIADPGVSMGEKFMKLLHICMQVCLDISDPSLSLCCSTSQ